jgi:hypothetical protein
MTWKDTIPLLYAENSITDEIIFQSIKAWRNRQLEASDWTQLADVDLSNKDAWATYRQELRDMLKGVTDPKLVIFPEPPK